MGLGHRLDGQMDTEKMLTHFWMCACVWLFMCWHGCTCVAVHWCMCLGMCVHVTAHVLVCACAHVCMHVMARVGVCASVYMLRTRAHALYA